MLISPFFWLKIGENSTLCFELYVIYVLYRQRRPRLTAGRLSVKINTGNAILGNCLDGKNQLSENVGETDIHF